MGTKITLRTANQKERSKKQWTKGDLNPLERQRGTTVIFLRPKWPEWCLKKAPWQHQKNDVRNYRRHWIQISTQKFGLRTQNSGHPFRCALSIALCFIMSCNQYYFEKIKGTQRWLILVSYYIKSILAVIYVKINNKFFIKILIYLT